MSEQRILVVEDQNIIAMDLQSRLVSLGYAVVGIASRGEDAIEFCRDLNPDLVLMDIRLKGRLDGIQAAEKIRAQADLPIIYLTAHSDEQTLQRARQTEPYGYLLKPFEDRELHLTIEIALYKHRMERRLRDSERWLSAVLQGIGEAVIATDVQGNVRLVNPVASRLIGLPADAAIGRAITDVFTLIDAQTRAPIGNPLLNALDLRRGVSLPERALLVSNDGREVPIDDSAAPIQDANGEVAGAVLVFRDITERLRTEQQLRHMAYHDALTGLPNRALFQILVNRAIADSASDGRRWSVLFLDLDRFKAVNDSLGHALGDQVLKAVAARLTDTLPPEAVLARFGGDEFTILLETPDGPHTAAAEAEKLLRLFTAPFGANDQEFFIGASIGVSVFPTDGADAATLIRNADSALSRVKDRGRHSYAFYQTEMNAGALSRLALESDLRHALDRGEFELYYQPKVEIPSGRLIGAEALIRWRHPTLGLIPPVQFLGLAEETGLILQIGTWVMREACGQARVWRDAGLPDLRVAVNLSNRQFRHPDLIALVSQALAETGLPAHALEIELTETIVMHDRADSVAKVRSLKQMGVRLAIDDFGTGYSSLEYMKLFQVDGLKIDRAFIRNAHVNREDEAIIQAIVTLAHSLGILVTAEGIETVEQQACVQTCLCDEGQGYLFGRPMTAQGFLDAARGTVTLKAMPPIAARP